MCDKALNIAKNPKYDRYQCGLASMVCNFFDKKTSCSGIKNSDQQLAEELHNKRKVQWPFIDNNWGADLVDMQLINKSNKGFSFLLCVIDIYGKYT